MTSCAQELRSVMKSMSAIESRGRSMHCAHMAQDGVSHEVMSTRPEGHMGGWARWARGLRLLASEVPNSEVRQRSKVAAAPGSDFEHGRSFCRKKLPSASSAHPSGRGRRIGERPTSAKLASHLADSAHAMAGVPTREVLAPGRLQLSKKLGFVACCAFMACGPCCFSRDTRDASTKLPGKAV